MIYSTINHDNSNGDVSQLERRQARDGSMYTAEEFQQFYEDEWENYWNWADRVHTTVLPAQLAVAHVSQPAVAPCTNVSQPAAAAANVSQPTAAETAVGVRLHPSMLIGIRQQEAARGPPRSLHKFARDALNQMSEKRTYREENLDNCFDWVPYVAAHARCDEIVGSGITYAEARFGGTRDHNRGGAPRLDFWFYRTDGTLCRVHPGNKPKHDAQLIFQQIEQ